MKLNRSAIVLIIVFALITNLCLPCFIKSYAHESILNVSYDYCSFSWYSNTLEIDKKWYVIEDLDSEFCHISDTEQTIKYYFADESPDGYRWDTDISQQLAEEIKTSFANSMKKWNNVYIYSYDSSGNIIKNKVINIVEGTFDDHNLVIYPEKGPNRYAHTDFENDSKIKVQTDFEHYHISRWVISINIEKIYLTTLNEDAINVLEECTGAHEIGHILGLRDIDSMCDSSCAEWHHEELLMGYGEIVSSRQTNITYKDLAGVAITRGFHTDADHKWLNEGQQSDGTYKLRCSLCNGVRYVATLNGYVYDMYNACNGNHELSDGNMMAVASYGTSDYYKCKYCKYVAPFSSIVPQNYIFVSNSRGNGYTNMVEGLEYTYYYERHSFTYTEYSESWHKKTCACGYTDYESHNFLPVNLRFSKCSSCGHIRDKSNHENVHLGIEDNTKDETE